MRQEDYIYKLTSLTVTEEGTVAEVELIPECSVYEGHFPGMPVTPGVLLLSVAREIVEKITRMPCRLTSVKDVRFLKVLTPELSPVRIIVRELVVEGDVIRARMSVEKEDTVFAKMAVTYHRGPWDNG